MCTDAHNAASSIVNKSRPMNSKNALKVQGWITANNINFFICERRVHSFINKAPSLDPPK